MSLSPVPKRLLEGPQGLTILPGSEDRKIWVPARRTLKHTHFTLPEQLRGAKRTSALKIKINSWSPFNNTDYSVVWFNNSASVFAWDHDLLSKRITDLGYNPTEFEVLPEAFLRSPAKNGVRLVACNDGIEAQVWTDGFLKASRWWQSRPLSHEWSLFARTSGAGSNFTIPDVVEPEWLEIPWNTSRTNGYFFGQILRHEPFMAACIAILMAPCLYFSSEFLTYSMRAWTIQQEINTIEVESQTIRTERVRALNALETAEDLVALRRHPHQIEIISRAHNLLRQFDVTLINWDYDEGVLEFALESESDMDARQFISEFENDALFSSVSAGTRNANVIMRMKVAEALSLEQFNEN
jgi:hypothetical protein